jgi:hypothetical protein
MSEGLIAAISIMFSLVAFTGIAAAWHIKLERMKR